MPITGRTPDSDALGRVNEILGSIGTAVWSVASVTLIAGTWRALGQKAAPMLRNE